ncbi:MAG: phytoene desaturase family protein [Actinocrinis sp.]
MARIIVVGAGMAGLAAAARMASRGDDVVVCEASPVAGGALRAWRHGDLGFDLGAHTLTLPAAYRDLFIKTGSRKKSAAAALEDRVDLRPLDPVRRYVFPDGARLDLPNSSRGRVVAAFDDTLGPGAGAAWLRVVDHGGRAWDAIRPALVESPGGGRELARLLRTADGRRALTPLRTLRTSAGKWFADADPRLYLLLDDYARQAGADPRHAPGVVATRPYIEHAFGAWRIVGGMHTLADALYQRVLDRGVEVRLNARVARIDFASGGVGGVVLEGGERLDGDAVIAAVDQAVLARLLGRSTRRRSQKSSNSAAVTTVCLVIDEPPEMPHETVLLDERGPAVRVHVAAERPEAWTVHAPADQSATADQSADAVVAVMAARGIDVRGKVRVRHVVGAADWEAATGVPGGAAFGPTVAGLRSALLRSPIEQATPGLFHAGASARPGSGLSFAALSGWQASELAKAWLRGRVAAAGPLRERAQPPSGEYD